ncbi:SDR family oxidoreductase [Lichenifustis flavocetrariae]|uniref:SDR family oxidoreductase n=1 Tax=Lichenifustis flavocetrariae TaxID=2949735 RepID=A0AA41YVH7_9HYPH|nr:SDR family oxidoreductase [Lichenifustis flavocetrariae]MCW6507678.1 SDR family oxidoreductase [Lichenifustis flavocetrariae]
MTQMRAALVTGGAARLGATIAERLARAGFSVVIHCNRSRKQAEALVMRLSDTYGVATGVVARDLATLEDGSLVTEAAAALGRPFTLLVNNASIYETDDAANFNVAGFDRHMAVNLRAPLLLAQTFAAQAPDGSSIVNLLDQRVLRPTPRQFTYTLSKAALHTATRTLAQSLAPAIRVNAVAPGLTLVNAGQDAADYTRRTADLPLRTGGTPDEVAEAVLYCATTPSLTGQTLALDGGQHLAWQTAEYR